MVLLIPLQKPNALTKLHTVNKKVQAISESLNRLYLTTKLPASECLSSTKLIKNFFSSFLPKNLLHLMIVNLLGKFVTNVLEKANISNGFFSQQCQSISNESIIPLIPFYNIDNRLTDINFNYAKLLRLIQYFDPKYSVSMLKPSCLSIIKTLFIVFCDRLKIGTSPNS